MPPMNADAIGEIYRDRVVEAQRSALSRLIQVEEGFRDLYLSFAAIDA
jgi:hypothetical protein